MICLLVMYNKGYASSSLNLLRSALNLFSSPNNDFANNIFISRLFSLFYKKRPRIVNYIVYWPVEKVLRFLKSWHPVDQLSMKKLTINSIAITTSDRRQTLHLMNKKKIHIPDNSISFIISN